MSALPQIVSGFRRVRGRMEEFAVRIKSMSTRISQLEQRVFGFVPDPSAVLAAPGSPVLPIGEVVPVRITGADTTPGVYQAQRRVPGTTFGVFADDSDDTETLLVRTLPLFGDGDQREHFAQLPTGLHGYVRWEGGSPSGQQFYHWVGPIPPQPMLVQSVEDDHLVCHWWDFTSEGEDDILVAKPWHLRVSSYDGKTVNGITYDYSGPTQRTCDDGDDEQTEIIIPRYQAASGSFGGDVIFAAPAHTGVTVGGSPLGWLDLNVDGRAWAKTL